MMTVKQQETIRHHALSLINYASIMTAYPSITSPENVFSMAMQVKAINDVMAELKAQEESCKQAAA